MAANQIEKVKTRAAAMAASTFGRSRQFKGGKTVRQAIKLSDLDDEIEEGLESFHKKRQAGK